MRSAVAKAFLQPAHTSLLIRVCDKAIRREAVPGHYVRHAKAQRVHGLPQNSEVAFWNAAASEYLLYRRQHGCCKNLAKTSKDACDTSMQVYRLTKAQK